MKPWISALTWSLLRLIAPVRRSFHAAFDVTKKLEKQGDFVSAKGVQSNGMRLRTELKDFSTAIKWLILDRHELVERKAYDAQIAHDNNDVRGCFAVVRALHGGKPRAHKTILKKCCEKTQNEIKEKKGDKNIGLRFFKAASLNFIVVDLLKVARMNIARIWICRRKRWKCRLPEVVGTKPLVVTCNPTR